MSNFENSNSQMKIFGESSGKRPRGRPLGSKNKPKGNPFPPQATNKIILEVPNGINIIQRMEGFAQDNGVSLAILTASGSISKATLKPKGSELPLQEFSGELSLVSFSGVYVNSPSGGGSSTTKFFNASLRSDDGSTVVSGTALHMVAFGPVQLTVFIFSNPKFYNIATIA